MLHFIVVDDYKSIVEDVCNLIDETMFKESFEYKKHCFFDYNDDFFEKINQISGLKIYILDVVTKSKSGLEIANFIRKNDASSIIIFLTAYPQKGGEVLQNNFMSLTFIVKDEQYQKGLLKALKKAVQMLVKRPVLQLQKNGVSYFIPYGDIIYIYREKIKRKTVIVTDYQLFFSHRPLIFWEKKLKNFLLPSHRACLVNRDWIYSIDRKRKKIIFNNGLQTYLMRRGFYVDE